MRNYQKNSCTAKTVEKQNRARKSMRKNNGPSLSLMELPKAASTSVIQSSKKSVTLLHIQTANDDNVNDLKITHQNKSTSRTNIGPH